MKIMIICVNGDKKFEQRNGEFTLEELQAAVGGYIERFTMKYKGADVWVNEDGMMTCPINRRASLIFKQKIYGNVVIEGWQNEDGTFGR